MNNELDGWVPGEMTGLGSAPTEPVQQRLDLRFTGSGWEYFRIWAVNLALMVVTLGIYYPWARVRKLRYVYANTTIDGDALTYHATGFQLFKGMLVAGLMLGAINLLGVLAPGLAALSGLAFWLLLPWFWASAMRFRLRQTSWRGVRFGFRGGVGGAYRALGGGALLVSACAVVLFFALTWAEGMGAGTLAMVVIALLGVGLLAAAASLMVLWLRRYQHNHYAFGSLTVSMNVSWGQVWRASLAGMGVLGSLFVLFVLFGVLGLLGMALAEAREPVAVGVVIWVFGGFYLLFPLVSAYVSARYQNLFWGATQHPQLQVRSALSPWRLVGVTLLNILLTALTLGLYWPFAMVRVLRLRLEAMSLESSVDWATVRATATAGDNSLGDMAMDGQGVDFGF